ncbi:Noc2-domain-containing protein [Multifurca ochricompacta]|uniref:Noc2-domain-containing protein n=1 Tax=Multifurca ochricompacta TaxID=376703 RepID=A0AAD4QLN1_9AGAM|nr:Noc2-domain-containing protein [Multifurca ochricompacta]
MAKRGAKATRKFAASGQLTKKIQARRKHQQIQKKIKKHKGPKSKGQGQERASVDGTDDETTKEKKSSKTGLKGMSVDDFLGASFMEEEERAKPIDGSSGPEDEDDDDGDLDESDGASFASVDELEDEGNAHMLELSNLAEKDPEFYKYLQENDRELLEFNADGDDYDDSVGDAIESDDDQLPTLTEKILRTWQKSLLETRSLRALRKLLVAFRSAALMNEEGKVLAWTIDNPAVYDKLVKTALRYTPIVLEHHVPYKTLPNGRFKAPAHTQKLKTLQKPIISFFHNIIHITSHLSDPELLKMAVTESTKIVPYIISSRKTVKQYLKGCLGLWSTADDSVRMATVLALRKLASAADESILDLILKNIYQTLVKSSKSTSAHSLPSITFMKNSASEIFCLNHRVAYQHAFGYIRQLAIHLRNSMKLKTRESYKQVYNWQYVHAIDFWSLVLARACEVQSNAKDDDLRPLIYPLVQVATGAIKLLSHPRSHPFHLHVVGSLIHLTRHTHTYIPLAPHLLPILTTALTSTKSKTSTLRPLDFETALRVPQQYLHTHVYAESLGHEATFLTVEWLSVRAVHGNIAFPELVVPIVASLRRALKAAHGNPKVSSSTKALVERVEESARWVSQRRARVTFAPEKTAAVDLWEADLQLDDAPLIKYMRVLRKTREKQRKFLEKARKGEDEILEE